MGRARLYNDDFLQEAYSAIYAYIRDSKKEKVSLDELAKNTIYNKAQISKALQYGRRGFELDGFQNIKYYIMASPNGYFIPKSSTEIVAYVAQVYKDAKSRMKTTTPIYEYAMRNYPEELSFALNAENDFDPDDPDNHEMQPWGVWNNLMN